MPEYLVRITQTITRNFKVEALNKEEALKTLHTEGGAQELEEDYDNDVNYEVLEL